MCKMYAQWRLEIGYQIQNSQLPTTIRNKYQNSYDAGGKLKLNLDISVSGW